MTSDNVFSDWLTSLVAFFDNIHVLHVGEGNMKIYSAKSIIFPEGIAPVA